MPGALSLLEARTGHADDPGRFKELDAPQLIGRRRPIVGVRKEGGAPRGAPRDLDRADDLRHVRGRLLELAEVAPGQGEGEGEGQGEGQA